MVHVFKSAIIEWEVDVDYHCVLDDEWTKVANQFLVEILAKIAIVIYACSTGPSKNVGGGGGGIYLVANYDHIPTGKHYETCGYFEEPVWSLACTQW